MGPTSIVGHWILIIKSENGLLEVFDSLGAKEEDVECMSRLAEKCQFNETAVQAPNSESCGLFCLYTAFWRLSDFDLSFGAVLAQLFSKNLEENEHIVKEFQKSWL